MDAHGGTITAQSVGEGLGSTFTVCLPLLDESRQGTPSKGSHFPTSRAFAYFAVDDSPDTRDLLQFVLNAYGAEVDVAPSAEAAFAVPLKPPHPQRTGLRHWHARHRMGTASYNTSVPYPTSTRNLCSPFAVTAYAREEESTPGTGAWFSETHSQTHRTGNISNDHSRISCRCQVSAAPRHLNIGVIPISRHPNIAPSQYRAIPI